MLSLRPESKNLRWMDRCKGKETREERSGLKPSKRVHHWFFLFGSISRSSMLKKQYIIIYCQISVNLVLLVYFCMYH